MRIFLTGATGFLGSRVLSQLEGHELLCLSRSTLLQDKRANISVRSLLGDLAQPHTWKTEVKQFAPQACLHLAWEGLPDYSLPRCRSNLSASIKLIETLADVGIKHLVVAGSCWEYGNASGAVNEDQPAKDEGLFAATKRSLRVFLESFAPKHGFEYRWARIFFVYGPGQRAASLIPQCHAAYSLGKQPEIRNPGLTQDFVYVDDVAQGLVALTQANVGSGVFNIGSGVPTTVSSIVNRVAEHFGAPPLFPSCQPTSGFWADISKITATTNWRTQTPIDDGIRQTLKALDHK
ncbi:MAG: NAD(P)-dependent oxidoreductase [Deltaproteobacteria bacterium]|nr:NAD(P)-dependent oxidoreductase [Deltaproteobacteria bacterium]